ncbi:MAG: type II secretion system GspH family protein [Lentisphaeraceae bacterium]|nr:type II secretion system GspH family protein [Lentisphaeraceae bacterium]
MKPFTLIELLVVIAIIGVLSSILLPSISGSLAVSKRVVCINNSKQNSMGINFYIGDNDQRMPIDWVNGGAPWQRHLKSYMSEGSEGWRTFICPTDNRDGVNDIKDEDLPWAPDKWLISYAYNGHLRPWEPEYAKGVPVGLVANDLILTVDALAFSVIVPWTNEDDIPLDRHPDKSVVALWSDNSVKVQKNTIEVRTQIDFWNWR